MTRHVSRRFFLGSAAALAALGSSVSAAPLASSLRPVMRGQAFFKRAVRNPDDIIKAQGLTGDVAFAVADATDGTWLESRNGQAGTPPASVTKAVTALYALDALGAAHRFETSVRVTGGIVDGEVQGDLILVGGGDPNLDTVGLADLASQLKDAGIIGVKGDFKVYEGALPLVPRIDPEQPDQVGYSPGVSGFALNYNRVHFEWKRANGDYAITMEARAGNYAPAVAMATMAVRDGSAPVFTYADEGGVDRWTVARGALGTGGARWLPVRRPGQYAGDVFATLARSEGIVLSKPTMVDDLPEGKTVASLKSATLIEILEDMLRYSNNLTAEMVGLAATQARQGPVPDLRSSAAAMNRWATQELGMIAPKLVDHSGLSDDSTVTAQDMARAMVKVHGGALRPILKPFGMRDQNGRPMDDHPIAVEAKTGTLNFVSGLSGYATARDGRVLAFAIFAANPEERAKISRAERERPPGARAWNSRAKRVQQALLERWGVLYGTKIAGN